MNKYILALLFGAISVEGWSQDFPKREMRAVWIATVDNIDWPSSDSSTVDRQKKEMVELLDLVQQYHMNTVIFQIRPAADALYASNIEPWSKWLTGVQGKAPNPFYDPLEFTIRECRKRGLDIHAWLNPYRALKDTTKNTAAVNHITRVHPEWFISYGNTKYFDPGLPQTRDFVAKVVSDIVRRYDIDAVHMDDYFYPYRINKVNFPDDQSFAAYSRGYSSERRDDWRRENVDMVIEQIHDSIRVIKPWVEFGISPFGVWRNEEKDSTGSKTKAGQTNYDDLFADILKWQKKEWIDYVVPQLYWQIGFKVADYATLCGWWSRNAYGTKLYIGQAPYRISRKAKVKSWRTSREIIRQVKLNRTYPNVAGSMFFSAKSLRNNPMKLKQKLLRKVFRYSSLTPSNNRITAVVPEAPLRPLMKVKDGTVCFTWDKGNLTKNFILYKFRKGKAANMMDPKNILSISSETFKEIPLDKCSNPAKYYFVITSQSPANIESEPVYFNDSDFNSNK
jgi:uncharacterized lipoprotein YddW (UPF0748 family)